MQPRALQLLPLLAALACSAGGAPGEEPPAADAQTPPSSGREVVLQALEPPQPSADPLTRDGVFATIVSSLDLSIGNLFRGAGYVLRGFHPEEDHHQRDFELELSDGTKVGGLRC
jgi:hypothetical protein